MANSQTLYVFNISLQHNSEFQIIMFRWYYNHDYNDSFEKVATNKT